MRHSSLLLPIFALALAGCVAPYTDAERTPDLVHVSPGSVAVAVVDQRADVVSGRHSPRYDGHNTAAYGIPIPHEAKSGEAMADHLASMVAAGLKAKGARPQTVSLAVGTPVSAAQARVALIPADRHLLLVLRQWYTNTGGVSVELSYDVEATVLDRGGRVVASKTFKADDEKIRVRAGTMTDIIDGTHRTKLAAILSDYEIAKAL